MEKVILTLNSKKNIYKRFSYINLGQISIRTMLKCVLNIAVFWGESLHVLLVCVGWWG